MDIAKTVLDGELIDDIVCEQCGSKTHKSLGVIKYFYILFDFLPFCPVGTNTKLKCTECGHYADPQLLSIAHYKSLHKSLFPATQILKKCIGIFLVLLATAGWFMMPSANHHKNIQYLADAQIDDYYFLDFRHFSKKLRPEEKYRVAKLVDITGNTYSFVYSNFYYPVQAAIPDAFRYGQVTSYDYFGKRRYDFTKHQLQRLVDEGGIYEIQRPVNNVLYGMSLETRQPDEEKQSKTYFAGQDENNRGLALLRDSYVEGNTKKAFEWFEKSAKLGYKRGQTNLANMYLKGEYPGTDLTKALHWYKEASLQSYKPAIEKYIIVCKHEPTCFIDDFYKDLKTAGVNIRVNK